MFVRGMCISTLWSFQNQSSECSVNTFVLGTTSVLKIFRKKLFLLKEIKTKSKFEMYLKVHLASQP